MPAFSKLLMLAEELAAGEPAGTVRPLHASHLRVVHGVDPGMPRTFDLGTDSVAVLGRSVEADEGLRLSGAEISRRHARIERGPEGWRMLDLRSRNGVFVDGKRVGQAPLADGSVLRVGGVVLLFVEMPAPASDGRRSQSRLSGVSQSTRELRKRVEVLAGEGSAVLVTGEAGTGKTLIVEELHQRSGRREPLVTVDCSLVRRDEPWSAARPGVLVLDEVGELPLILQARLHAALPHLDGVRVIATSSRDLTADVRSGRFHPDLYVALTGRRVDVAPLRNRRDDVLPLVARIAGHCRITAHVAEALVLHHWPGNIRELEETVTSAIRRAGTSRTVRLEHLPRPLAARLHPLTRPQEVDQEISAPGPTKATR